ncbi:MAG: hypothetical protein ACRD15_10980 [Vicinamibacterales bacterium]
MNERRRAASTLATALCVLYAMLAQLHAHAGPPYPIVSDRQAGPYEVSVWTDPDATDDGSAGGQFWVTIRLADGSALPAETRARLSITPADRPGPARSGTTSPVNGDVSRQFVALLMDHEGRFAVQAAISGARGSVVVDAEVDATYDLRPPPATLALYVLPFLAVGFLWLKMLVHRRRGDREPQRR